MSTSVTFTVMGSPSILKVTVPAFSNWAISSCDRPSICAATAFISLPNFFPITRKLHLTFFTSIPCPSANFSSLTLTSFIIKLLTASIWAFCSLSTAGIMICCSGWRTFTFTFLRRANTIDVIFWAMLMRSSRSISTSDSSTAGNLSRCTDFSFPPKSWYNSSA